MAHLITDTAVYDAQPVNGIAYTAWGPGETGFPTPGSGSYVCPVFGSTIIRLTDQWIGEACQEFPYTFHYINCDGTRCFSKVNKNDLDILDMPSGNVYRTAQPWDGGTVSYGPDTRWSMTNPDVYYFLVDADLRSRNVVSQSTATVKTFPANLIGMGATANYQTADGRYWVVRFNHASYGGDKIHVWDSQLDEIYTGNVAPGGGDNYSTISPDGAFLITCRDDLGPDRPVWAYPINHVTKSVDATGWEVAGQGWAYDHSAVISASDGKTYCIIPDGPGTVYIFDASVNRGGMSATDQKADAKMSIAMTSTIHLSGVSKGALKNFVFFGTYGGSTTADMTEAYEREIFAADVVNEIVYRLAHNHCIYDTDPSRPKVSCAADGTAVLWLSSHDINTPTGYADMYAIINPLAELVGGTAIGGWKAL